MFFKGEYGKSLEMPNILARRPHGSEQATALSIVFCQRELKNVLVTCFIGLFS